MRIKKITGTRAAASTGRRMFDPSIEYAPSVRDGLLWVAPLRDNARTIYDNGVVAYVDPSAQEIDADGTYLDTYDILQDAILDELRIEKNGARIEGTQENVFIESENFDLWDKVNGASVTVNSDTAPNGITTADTITDDSASLEHIEKNVAIADDSTWWSDIFWIKKDSDETRFAELLVVLQNGTQVNIYVQINTKTGATAVRQSSGTVKHSVGPVGIYWKFTASCLNNGTGNTEIRSLIMPARSSVLGGTSAAVTGSIVAGGFQAVNAEFSSSYIRTAGSSVTRTIDVLKYPLVGNVDVRKGSVFFAVYPDFNSGDSLPLSSQMIFDANANGGNDRVYIYYVDSSKFLVVKIVSDGVNVSMVAPGAYNGFSKGVKRIFCLTWDVDSVHLYIDNVQFGEDLTASPMPLIAVSGDIQIGAGWWGNCSHFKAYDRVVSAAERQTIHDEIDGWAP